MKIEMSSHNILDSGRCILGNLF